ncbi:hypothetical protein ACJX0J_013427, partial [Zea mays]
FGGLNCNMDAAGKLTLPVFGLAPEEHQLMIASRCKLSLLVCYYIASLNFFGMVILWESHYGDLLYIFVFLLKRRMELTL